MDKIEFWYGTDNNTKLIFGQTEGLILVELSENDIVTVIYGNGRFGYTPYFIS